jgi:hypothetical protein
MHAPKSIVPVLKLSLGIALPLAWLTGCQQTNTQPLIAARAVAVAAPAPASAPQPAKSFVFAKGRNVGSSRELDKVDFDVIARPLVVDLKAANLEPAADVASADLVILVNWGRTAVAAEAGSTMMYDLDDLRRADSAVEDARTQAQAALQSGNLAEHAQARGMVAQAEADRRHELIAAQAALSMDLPSSDTADLLGIRDLLAKSEFSPNSDTIRGLLEDERYFVGLVAYDGRELRRQTSASCGRPG